MATEPTIITEEMIQAALARADWPCVWIPFFSLPTVIIEEEDEPETEQGDVIQAFDDPEVQS